MKCDLEYRPKIHYLHNFYQKDIFEQLKSHLEPLQPTINCHIEFYEDQSLTEMGQLHALKHYLAISN